MKYITDFNYFFKKKRIFICIVNEGETEKFEFHCIYIADQHDFKSYLLSCVLYHNFFISTDSRTIENNTNKMWMTGWWHLFK